MQASFLHNGILHSFPQHDAAEGSSGGLFLVLLTSVVLSGVMGY